MQKLSCKKSGWKLLLPAAVTGTMLLAPLTVLVEPAAAKPPRHAPAYGYRKHKKAKSNRSWKRSDRSQWRRSERRRTWSDWRDRDDSKRRYRLRYRTRYDRYGNPFRQWFRSYY